MEEIDELVPLTDEDIKILEGKKLVSSPGCGILLLVIFLIAVFLTWWTFTQFPLLSIIPGIISILVLFAAWLTVYPVNTAKTDGVMLDLQEGKKRRIVAPIETKDVVDVTRSAYTLKQQIRKSYEDLKFEYYITIKGYKFEITEEEFLTGTKKGSFMEFYVAPHSDEILSKAVEVDE